MLYNFHKAVIPLNRIKNLRLAKNWTQDDLGKMLNCSGVSIGRYEQETRGLDVETICRLCDIFGCTADYLLGRSDRPDPELTPEEEQLLAAWAEAPAEIRAIIDAALAPYKKDVSASEPTA